MSGAGRYTGAGNRPPVADAVVADGCDSQRLLASGSEVRIVTGSSLWDARVHPLQAGSPGYDRLL